jgi:prepilin-type N-terminal cleavage/methylation domain-containing protein
MNTFQGPSIHRPSAGFTLIETLITLVISATLGILATQIITNGIRAKNAIQYQVSEASKVRDASRLIKHDLELAFHPTDVEQLIEKETLKFNPTDPMLKAKLTYNFERSAPRDPFETHFMGTETEIAFVTTNVALLNENLLQADYGTVAYKLDACKSLGEKKESNGKCLWRRSNRFVNEELGGGESVSILEDVTEFKLQYFGSGKTEWVSEWKSRQTDDAATKGKYPKFVKINLTVTKKEKGTDKRFSIQSVATIHFPNNPVKETLPPSPNPQNNPEK